MPILSPKGIETKSHILRVAAELFCEKGVHATSPEDIIQAAQIGKGQFYHYFKSKEGLIHEVLLWYLQELRAARSPLLGGIRSWADVKAWFQAHIDFQRRFGMKRGCIFGTAANEITETDEAMADDLQMIFDGMSARLALFFAEEKRAGRLAPVADEHSLADFCIATVQGAMLLGKIRRSGASAENIARQAVAHLEQLVIA